MSEPKKVVVGLPEGSIKGPVFDVDGNEVEIVYDPENYGTVEFAPYDPSVGPFIPKNLEDEPFAKALNAIYRSRTMQEFRRATARKLLRMMLKYLDADDDSTINQRKEPP